MIERYSTETMTQIFSEHAKYNFMMEVELTCAEVQAQMGLIPKAAAKKIRKNAKFQINRILEIEKTTKHDVIAFVSNLAENVGPEGRFIHFGLTSSDVLDTALSLQLSAGLKAILLEINKLESTFLSLIKKHKNTLCPGRTHGIFAEVTTFGFKLAGFYNSIFISK